MAGQEIQLMLAVMDDVSDGLCFEDGQRRKPRVSANRHNDWPACGISGLLICSRFVTMVCSVFRQM